MPQTSVKCAFFFPVWQVNNIVADMCDRYTVCSVSQKKVAPPPKTFCSIFSPNEPVWLKITLVIAQTYCYVYTTFGPYI